MGLLEDRVTALTTISRPLLAEALWTEVELLKRVLHRNRLQHRGSRHHRTLTRLRRSLGDVRAADAAGCVAALADALSAQLAGGVRVRAATAAGRKPMSKAHAAVSTQLTPQACAAMATKVVTAAGHLRATAHLLESVMSDVLHAAAAIRMLLQQSYFVPFALACFSALARIQVLLSQLLVDTVHAHNLATELGIQQPASSASTAAPPAALRCCWSDDGVPTVTAVGDAAVQAAVGAAGGMGDEDLGTCVVVARATTTVRGADESGCAGGRTNTSSNNTAGFPVMEVSATGARWRREAAGGEVRVDIAQGGVTGCADTPRTHNAGCGTMTKVPMGEATAVCGEGGDEAVAAAQDRGTQQAVQSLDSIDVGTAGGAAAVVAAAGVATTGAAAKKRRKADRWLQQLQTGGGESETRKRAKKKAAPEDAIDDIFAMLTKGKGKQ